MFTVTKTIKLSNEGKSVVEATCLQTDGKPNTYANGSILLEIDTSTVYVFDEANSIWRAWL